MRYLLLMLAGLPLLCSAHPDSLQTLQHEKPYLLGNISVELPVILELGYIQYTRSAQLSKLPYDLNQLQNNGRAAFAGGVIGNTFNTSTRLIGITWKDKIGLEIDKAAYASVVTPTKYAETLEKQYPGYKLSGITINGNNQKLADMLCFKGFMYGVHYNMHWHKFELQAKLLVGFNSRETGSIGSELKANAYYYDANTWQKEIKASIYSKNTNPHRGVYVLQMLAKRCISVNKNKETHFKWEFGLKGELAFVPYHFERSVTTTLQNTTTRTIVVAGNDLKTSAGLTAYWSFIIK